MASKCRSPNPAAVGPESSAAARSPVHILTTDPALPYARPPLSKEFLRGETEDVLLHPAEWYDERRIDVVHTRVERIDPEGHVVIADGLRFVYSSLILTCGSAPVPLPVPGGARAYQLRSLADAQRLRDGSSGADSAVVIGAGFIGCEAAQCSWTTASRSAVTSCSPQQAYDHRAGWLRRQA
ncbi:MAG: FAD/NAD(P)-binding oxidoreductase [Mycobacterium sp.]